jgi:AcrR family transcriptional regulator
MTALRADAQRNLTRVLEAAAEAFNECGPDVSVDEIARRAGVGHATVFRRFPTKDALMRAVVRQRIDELAALARDALAAEDPGAAFTEFIWAAIDFHARDRGLFECMDRCLKDEKTQEIVALTEQIVIRAQKAGAVRRDLSPSDVTSLIGAVMTSAPVDQWPRLVEVVLDGLRPPAPLA